jgi:hypothetical protein
MDEKARRETFVLKLVRVGEGELALSLRSIVTGDSLSFRSVGDLARFLSALAEERDMKPKDRPKDRPTES